MSRRMALMISILALCVVLGSAAQTSDEGEKHASGLAGVPASAGARANPFEGKPEAVRAGRKLFERYCAECHGADLGRRGKAPTLDSGRVEQTPPGKLYWFLTNGNLRTGMPSWSRLPDAQRWQIVTYLKSVRKMPAQ